MKSHKKGSAAIWLLSIVVVILLIVVGAVAYFSSSSTSGRGGTSNADTISLGGSLLTGQDPTQGGTLQVGLTGTGIAHINAGTCTINAYSATIAATGTAQVDCSAGVSGPVAITGILPGDRILASLASTTVANNEGLDIQWAAASTTPGYITLKIFNGSGAAYTWVSTASSSITYFDFK